MFPGPRPDDPAKGASDLESSPMTLPRQRFPDLARLQGIALMVLAGIAFAAMAALVKCSRRLPVVELVFLRSVFALAALAALLVRHRRWPRASNRTLLLVRTICGLVAVGTYFYAIAHLDLAIASLLNQTSPVFVVSLAWFVPGERPAKSTTLLVLLAMFGCALLLSPGWTVPGFDAVAGLVGLSSGILSALAYTSVRLLRKTDRAIDIVFYFTTSALLVTAPFTALEFVRPSPLEWGSMAGAGLAAAVGQLFMTKAYQVERAAVVSPFIYTCVLVSALFGLLFWGETPTPLAALGGLLIVGSGVGIAVQRGGE